MSHAIGETVFWVESSTNYSKKIPCKMCFGKKRVQLILGDESVIDSSCGYCENGYFGPTGFCTIWEPMAEVKMGRITGISQRDGVRYEIGHKNLFHHEVYADAAIAEEIRKIKYEEVKKHAEEWSKENFVNCTKKQIWSAGYHQRCIEDAKRNIEWHTMRAKMIKERTTDFKAVGRE